MTTDTKAMARFNAGQGVNPRANGKYVLFTDHERVLEEVGLLWASELVKRDDALAASRAEVEGLKLVASHARNLAAWFTSGNSVPVDGVYTMKLSSYTVLDDARLLRDALAAMENNNV